MTDHITKAAKEAGGTTYTNRHYPGETACAFGPEALARFYAIARAEALEDAAEVAEAQQERIAELEALVEYLQQEVARVERNRDMWRNQCQHQADALTTMRPDAARYQFATAYNDEGRLNFKAIYDAWDGDGSFTDQIDAAIAAAKKEAGHE